MFQTIEIEQQGCSPKKGYRSMSSTAIVKINHNNTTSYESNPGPLTSIAIVDPNPERRNAVAGIVCALRPNAVAPRITTLSDVTNSAVLMNQGFDVILVAVDGDREEALRTIKALSSIGSATRMAYSEHTDGDILIQCLQAGVREFLAYPFVEGAIEEAFSRTASRGQLAPDTKKANGKSFVFLGAKGGSGVTTAACNFAVSLARESKRSTLLIDLDLPLGDAALNLGMTTEYSTLDALLEGDRLDATFLAKLLTTHKSGLQVLGAPGRYLGMPPLGESINKLLSIACNSFEYVVVDAGSRWELTETRLFDMISTIYLVTQVAISDLRNSNRLITGCLETYGHKLEIVLNRYEAELFGIDDAAIEGALTRAPQWKIPNDYPAVRRMQNTAETASSKNSRIHHAINSMARTASGVREIQGKKKKFGFFGFALGN